MKFKHACFFLCIVSLILLQPVLLATENRAPIQKKKFNHKTTRYVKAGSCGPGNGTRSQPWNSLNQAEADATWKTLIVLASPLPLIGGISLKDGQSLIGEKNPVKCPLSEDQCIISNPTEETHAGNAVIVSHGDVHIENIYFQQIWASAVNYDNARNISIKNVVATTYNLGGLKVPDNGATTNKFSTNYEVSAFQCTATQSGTSKYCNVQVRDNNAGYGVLEQICNKLQRKFIMRKCEFSNLRSGVDRGPGPYPCPCFPDFYPNVQNVPCGVFLVQGQQGTKVDVHIADTSFHDFMAPSVTIPPQINGVSFQTSSGADLAFTLDGCQFYNLGASQKGAFTIPISLIAETIVADVAPGVRGTAKGHVQNCLFEEPLQNSIPAIGFLTHIVNCDFEETFKNNISKGLYISFYSMEMGDSNSVYSIYDNVAASVIFYFATAGMSYNLEPAQFTTKTSLHGNTFTGQAGIVISPPNIDNLGTLTAPCFCYHIAACAPWKSLELQAAHNCFTYLDFGIKAIPGAGLLGLFRGEPFVPAPPCSAGNVVLNVHQNNIIGFPTDIFDFKTGCVYNAENNYWGHPIVTTFNFSNLATIHAAPTLLSPIACKPNPFCLFNISQNSNLVDAL